MAAIHNLHLQNRKIAISPILMKLSTVTHIEYPANIITDILSFFLKSKMTDSHRLESRTIEISPKKDGSHPPFLNFHF